MWRKWMNNVLQAMAYIVAIILALAIVNWFDKGE